MVSNIFINLWGCNGKITQVLATLARAFYCVRLSIPGFIPSSSFFRKGK